MNYLDLFSGIGGFHKGLEEAGFKFEWSGHSEIDKYAKSIYQSHFKESEDLGDVSNINVSDLPRAKKWIVTGGWPCQDNSIAGKRKGQRGSTRSGLLSQIIRLIRELIDLGAEVIFIGENVKGLFSVNDGMDFLDSIRGLTYLDKDSPQLTLEMQLLNTRWFLPQNRERVYFVGRSGIRSGKQVFPIGEEFKGIAERSTDSTVIRAFTAGGNSGGHHSGMTLLATPLIMARTAKGKASRRESMKKGKDFSSRKDRELVPRQDGCANNIMANQDKEQYIQIEKIYSISCNCGFVFEGVLSDKCPGCGEIKSGNTNEIQIGTLRTHKDGEGFREMKDGICPTIPARAREDGSGQPVINMSVANCLTPDAYLTRGERKRDENGKAVLTSICERRIRRLTPTEYERLQGFPDKWTAKGKDGEIISDTQRYKTLGNAVSVPVVKAVGKRLI